MTIVQMTIVKEEEPSIAAGNGDITALRPNRRRKTLESAAVTSLSAPTSEHILTSRPLSFRPCNETFLASALSGVMITRTGDSGT